MIDEGIAIVLETQNTKKQHHLHDLDTFALEPEIGFSKECLCV
ncbi:MAG: hypothetical protein ACI9JN_002876 [Bacteroidia bacterium]|jgi:hypothetical protein